MKYQSARWALLSVLAMSGCTTTTQQPASVGTMPAKETVELKPDVPINASTHFAAGQLAESQGDMPRAITQYQAALKLDPNLQPALLRLGMVYTSLRQFDDAVGIWHRYIKATNNSAAGYCNLGLTQELADRPKDAEAAYKTAIAREPKNEPARVNYGLMLTRQGRIDDALAQLQAVLTPAEAHYNVASVLEGEGKNEEAKSQYQQALQVDPQMSDAKTRLAALDTTPE